MHWAFRIGLLLQLALNVLSQQISVAEVQQDPTDRCEQDCSERHGLLDIMAMWSPRGACQQGCRFFTLASLMRRFRKNLADTVTTCQESCLEAYTSNSNGQACVEACGGMRVITERFCHGQKDIEERSMSPIKEVWDDVSTWFLATFNENSNQEPEFGQEFGQWEIRHITIGQVDSQDVNLFVVDLEIVASDSSQPEVRPLPEVLPEAGGGITPELQWHATIVVRNTLYSCLSKRFGIPQYLIGACLFILATAVFHSCIVFCSPVMLNNVSSDEKVSEEEKDQPRDSLPPSYYSVVKIPLDNDEIYTKETQFLLKETCPDQYHNVPIVPVHRL